MRICKLETKEFNFLEIYSCSVTKHVNKHATATVIGLMKDSEDALYRNLQTKAGRPSMHMMRIIASMFYLKVLFLMRPLK